VIVAIPNPLATHIIGQRGKGLKQVHDISGTWISAYTLVEGLRNERHISIWDTDKQISDALVVLGKRIHAPKPKKKTEPTAGELKAALTQTRAEASRIPYGRPSAGYAPAPAPPLQPTVLLHCPPHNDWSTLVSRTPPIESHPGRRILRLVHPLLLWPPPRPLLRPSHLPSPRIHHPPPLSAPLLPPQCMLMPCVVLLRQMGTGLMPLSPCAVLDLNNCHRLLVKRLTMAGDPLVEAKGSSSRRI